MGEKAYCDHCGWIPEDRYSVRKEIFSYFRGVKIDVEETIPYCLNCGSDIFVEAVDSVNLLNIYSKYKKLAGYVLPEAIREFRMKYNISKKELFDILNWTNEIKDFEEGSLQNDEQDEVLRRIIRDNNYFRRKVKNAYLEKKISESLYKSLLEKGN